MEFILSEILKTGNVDFQGAKESLKQIAKGISIDSRTIEAGRLYIALTGENYDGHAFVEEALSKGGVAAIVNRQYHRTSGTNHSQNLFVVEDTLKSMQQLARQLRSQLKHPVIALTGSNGKTTTKEMISAVLATQGATGKTFGNLNNHIGTPLTIFQLNPDNAYAVLEMGMNHFDEITQLCQMAEPDFGLITNIGHGHIEHLGGIEGVAKAKMEMFDYLQDSSGFIFANIDDANIAKAKNRYDYRLTYGFTSDAQIVGRDLGTDDAGLPLFETQGCTIKLPIPGAHNLTNALAAIAVGLRFGVPIEQAKSALEKVQIPGKRMQFLPMGGFLILNDCYNANPESSAASLQTLLSIRSTGKKWIVLGDMLELGDKSPQLHRELGKRISESNLAGLLGFGKLSRYAVEAAKSKPGFFAKHFERKTDIVGELMTKLQDRDLVLVKGSRGMQLEDIILELENLLKMEYPDAI